MSSIRLVMALSILVVYIIISDRDIQDEEKAEQYSYSEQSCCQVCNEVQ